MAEIVPIAVPAVDKPGVSCSGSLEGQHTRLVVVGCILVMTDTWTNGIFIHIYIYH